MSPALLLPPPDYVIESPGYASVYGEKGSPIVLIHGNGGSGAAFSKIVAGLMRHFRVILIDLPEHGQGPKGVSGFREDPQVSVDYCMRLLDAAQIKECHLGGHSLGGMIGLLMCIQAPSRFLSLTLLDSFVDFMERPAALLNTVSFCENGPNDEILEAKRQGHAALWHQWFDVTGQIPQICCPVLELQGEQNPGTQEVYEAWVREKRSSFPENWQTIRVMNAGHYIQIEQPEFVVQAMLRFYAKIK